MALELDPGVLGREAPVHRGAVSVAVGHPCRDLGRQCRPVGDTPVQALAAEHTELDLGDGEPTAVLGGGMDVEFVPDPLGFGRRERLVEPGRVVGVEVVEHQGDALGIRKVDVDQLAHHLGEVDPGAVVGDLDLAPPQQGRGEQEEVGGAAALVFGVVATRMAGDQRQRRLDLADQLLAGLVKADQRASGIERAGVEVEDVFQLGDEGGVLAGRDAPFLAQPGLEFSF